MLWAKVALALEWLKYYLKQDIAKTTKETCLLLNMVYMYYLRSSLGRERAL